MTTPSLFRTSLVAVLCLVLAVPAFPQYSPGPSNGQVAAAIVGAAAVITVAGVVIYRKTHKPSLTGCVGSTADGLSLTSSKDQKVYALSGDTASLKVGEQFTLKGKRAKSSAGTLIFRVETLAKDLGPCHQ